MDDEQLREIASQLSCPSGEQGHAMGDKMNATNAFITEKSLASLAAAPGETIVEIGPGNGMLSLPILRALGAEGRYIGLELSEDMAGQALANLRAHGSAEVEIHTGDCIAAPIQPGSTDAIMAVNVLYFIEDLGAFSTALSNWLKPGGRAVFGIRSEHSLGSMPFTRFGFRNRSFEEIARALLENGFSSVSSELFDEGMGKLGDLDIRVDAQIIEARVA